MYDILLSIPHNITHTCKFVCIAFTEDGTITDSTWQINLYCCAIVA